jgi:tRNA pseudouridine55 synthase
MNGVLVVNKPQGMTSHDVVRRVRHLAKQRDVGHLGTLDPMATGVLPLVLGRMTRIAQFYDHAAKAYEGTVLFGVATDTYDAEGKMVGEPASVAFTKDQLVAALESFRGEIEQTPPPFSAKKIAGVPAYKLARRNEAVELKAVRVTVGKFEITEFRHLEPDEQLETLCARLLAGIKFAEIGFVAEVSSGTYVRSLAHDLGQKLGCGAHLRSLCRTGSAEFTLEGAVSLEQLEAKAAAGELEDCAVPPRLLLPHMPGVHASDEQMAKIRHGNAVNLSEFSNAELIKVFYGQGELTCIAKRVAGTLFQPKVVLVG